MLYFCSVVMMTARTIFIQQLKKEVNMIELSWYENTVPFKNEKKWYVHSVQKQEMDIKAMAQHMEEHNTPFSAGTIEGILTDFVKCIREQILNGNTVKIDNLAIFKLSIESNGYDTFGNQDKDGRPTAIAKVGEGNAVVKSAKLLSQATGKMMRERLNLDVKFAWDTETQAEFDKLKKAAAGGGTEEPGTPDTPDKPGPDDNEEWIGNGVGENGTQPDAPAGEAK